MHVYLLCPELLQRPIFCMHTELVLFFTGKVLPAVSHLVLQESIDIQQNASLTCSVTGGCNVHYQWISNSGQFPSKVTGKNNKTLIIPDVRSADDNTYTCVASDAEGSVIAATQLIVTGMIMIIVLKFMVTVFCTGLPEVTVTPSSQSVEITHTAMFTTTVSGVGVENFMYQWRHNGTIITGETGDTLMITNVMKSDSGYYECIVTNQYGDHAISKKAYLSILSKLI